jgi:hypothetical protein
MGFDKPKATPIAAAPKQNALDIKRAQMDMEDNLRKRRGFDASTYAGVSPGNALG